MRSFIMLAIGLLLLTACGTDKRFTPLNSHPDFILLTKHNMMKDTTRTIKLDKHSSDLLIKELQEAGKHIFEGNPKGKYSCSKGSMTLYFINIYSDKNNLRTFSNTGTCNSIYDEKDNTSLISSVGKHLEKYFK